ncbi:DNA-3-methyladenine glycosylase 2 [Pseudomonas sp. 22 E 5]|nr:DNA-3-methyladenine glycosylase 2 [Pseudomonas sp. 22 E 5]
MRLAYQPPYDWAAMVGFLSARAIGGMETVEAGVYRRSISLGGQHGWISVAMGDGDWLDVEVGFPDAGGVA